MFALRALQNNLPCFSCTLSQPLHSIPNILKQHYVFVAVITQFVGLSGVPLSLAALVDSVDCSRLDVALQRRKCSTVRSVTQSRALTLLCFYAYSRGLGKW